MARRARRLGAAFIAAAALAATAAGCASVQSLARDDSTAATVVVFEGDGKVGKSMFREGKPRRHVLLNDSQGRLAGDIVQKMWGGSLLAHTADGFIVNGDSSVTWWRRDGSKESVQSEGLADSYTYAFASGDVAVGVSAYSTSPTRIDTATVGGEMRTTHLYYIVTGVAQCGDELVLLAHREAAKVGPTLATSAISFDPATHEMKVIASWTSTDSSYGSTYVPCVDGTLTWLKRSLPVGPDGRVPRGEGMAPISVDTLNLDGRRTSHLLVTDDGAPLTQPDDYPVLDYRQDRSMTMIDGSLHWVGDYDIYKPPFLFVTDPATGVTERRYEITATGQSPEHSNLFVDGRAMLIVRQITGTEEHLNAGGDHDVTVLRTTDGQAVMGPVELQGAGRSQVGNRQVKDALVIDPQMRQGRPPSER